MKTITLLACILICLSCCAGHLPKQSAKNEPIETALFEYLINKVKTTNYKDVPYYFLSVENEPASKKLIESLNVKYPKVLSRQLANRPNCELYDKTGIPQYFINRRNGLPGIVINIWRPTESQGKYYAEWIIANGCKYEIPNEEAILEEINGHWVVTESNIVHPVY